MKHDLLQAAAYNDDHLEVSYKGRRLTVPDCLILSSTIPIVLG